MCTAQTHPAEALATWSPVLVLGCGNTASALNLKAFDGGTCPVNVSATLLCRNPVLSFQVLHLLVHTTGTPPSSSLRWVHDPADQLCYPLSTFLGSPRALGVLGLLVAGVRPRRGGMVPCVLLPAAC
jgi:hypothetical protein